MIIPISLIFAFVYAYKRKKSAKTESSINYSFKRIFPWFILGFLGTSLLNTLGVFSENAVSILSATGKFLIVMALTAVGLNADFGKMIKTGLKPLLLGLIVWVTVSVVSIGVQLVTGQI